MRPEVLGRESRRLEKMFLLRIQNDPRLSDAITKRLGELPESVLEETITPRMGIGLQKGLRPRQGFSRPVQ
jgi:hypothetical protein